MGAPGVPALCIRSRAPRGGGVQDRCGVLGTGRSGIQPDVEDLVGLARDFRSAGDRSTGGEDRGAVALGCRVVVADRVADPAALDGGVVREVPHEDAPDGRRVGGEPRDVQRLAAGADGVFPGGRVDIPGHLAGGRAVLRRDGLLGQTQPLVVSNRGTDGDAGGAGQVDLGSDREVARNCGRRAGQAHQRVGLRCFVRAGRWHCGHERCRRDGRHDSGQAKAHCFSSCSEAGPRRKARRGCTRGWTNCEIRHGMSLALGTPETAGRAMR